MDIVSRLKIFMEHTTLPISQFADTALIPRPTLSQVLNGRNKKISNELIAKLHEAFPELNIMCLMFGDGNMLTEGFENVKHEPTVVASVESEDRNNSPSLFDVNATKEPSDDANDDFTIDFANNPPSPELQPAVGVQNAEVAHPQPRNSDAPRAVSYIMVFYDDNSFEVFHQNK